MDEEEANVRGATRVCLTRCPLGGPEPGVHSLPCHIHHDGAAPVTSYFQPIEDEQQEEKEATYTAAFRGVQLTGERVDLHGLGLQGLVLEDAGQTHVDDDGKIWEVEAHFDHLMHWQVPNASRDDPDLAATLATWTHLAAALHLSTE